MNASQFFGAMFGPLRQLADFSGRSARAQFWPFVFLLYAAEQVVLMIVMNPFMTKLQRLDDNGSAVVLSEAAKAEVLQSFTSMFGTIFWLSGIMGAVSIGLLAAVVTRRLHDTDRSGWWALPTALLGAAAMIVASQTMPAVISSASTGRGTFDFGAFWNALVPMLSLNLVYLVALIILIIFCVRDGTIGDNRFGPDPKGRDPAQEAERHEQQAALQDNREAARTDPTKRPRAARITYTDTSDPPN